MLSAGDMRSWKFHVVCWRYEELESFMLSAGDMRSWRVSCCLLEI